MSFVRFSLGVRRSATAANFAGAAFRHEGDTMRDLAHEAHFMGYDQHTYAVCREQADCVQHLADALWIKGGGYLVEQEDSGVQAQRTSDGNPLLLTA
jgi:hypothetical protein